MSMKMVTVQRLTKFIFILIGFAAITDTSAAPQGSLLVNDNVVPADICVECHQAQYDAISASAHWRVGDARTPAAMRECATCHGDLEEHALSEGQEVPDGMYVFRGERRVSPEKQNALCLTCHKESKLMHWQGSAHDAEGIGCVGCHRIHGEDRVRARETEQEICFACHARMRGDVNKPYGHPLREHKMRCSDCHGPHGGPGDAELKTFSVNESCYGCHADKRGPFLWEHSPVSENCVLCHSTHGSVHPGMLERRQPHLCQSCHEPTGPAGLGPPHAQHSRLGLSFREPGEPDLGPTAPPGGRGIARFVMGEACSNCHTKVHGSNHPAGAKLMR